MRQISKKWALALLAFAAIMPAKASNPGEVDAALSAPTAPEGAPNIVLVLLDDVGFGAASTFGGPAETPALDALAAEGLRYNRFHTTAICSPTRASLLTGHNPHATGIGAVQNSADARPGYTGVQSPHTASIARILKDHGYSTAAFGKWHQTPEWEVSQSGPFDRWPTGQGFEKFYGFQGGETDQFEPSLFRGTSPVMRPPGEDYHVTEDLADEAIEWMRSQQAVTPDKPFFLYFATGAIHAPVQAPAEWIARYEGRFDEGWDRLREDILARQKALGVAPADTRLAARPDGLPAWDTLTASQQKIASRLMEVYAAFLTHTDVQVGRIAEALKESGEFDNTIFIYIVGDNGASAEGGIYGSMNYMGALQGLPESEEGKLARLDVAGGPETYPHVNAAWAWATNTPFKWAKTVASHLGGTRNPLVVSWPDGMRARGELRSQFGHVNDIAPTLLEAIGIEAPAEVDGIEQRPMDGVSLLYSFDDAAAPERHETQYFEVFGHRSLYHEGWMASAFHSRIPWGVGIGFDDKPFEDDVWELYDLRRDFSQANDLADERPDKLAELRALFTEIAADNQVLPLSGQIMSGAGLPDLSHGRERATYLSGTIAVPEKAVPRMTNRSWSLAAEINADADPRGVIATIGGRSAGWSLFLDAAGRPNFTYRLFDVETVRLRGQAPLSDGPAALRVDFDYDGGGYAKGGMLNLVVDGETVAGGRLPASPPAFFSINETFDVGLDTGSAAGDYPEDAPLGYPFDGGEIAHVTIELR